MTATTFVVLYALLLMVLAAVYISPWTLPIGILFLALNFWFIWRMQR
jgi:hypothetical protein